MRVHYGSLVEAEFVPAHAGLLSSAQGKPLSRSRASSPFRGAKESSHEYRMVSLG